jgi:hypothetical protein
MTTGTPSQADPLSGRGDEYFARSMLWDWHNGEQIDLLAPDGGLIATLDQWHTAVFHGADGNRTVRGFLAWWRGHYKNPAEVPADLDEKIGKCLSRLADELGAVEFRDRADDLPYYFELPKREQDKAEAMRAMKEDGLIPED